MILIGDGDDKTMMAPAPGSKRHLREMVERAFANTPGAVPVRKIAESTRAQPKSAPEPVVVANNLPSAHQIATAIVYASREVGADPVHVAMGVSSRGLRDLEIAQARAYAALALKTAFPELPNASIGRCVGSKFPSNYIALLNARRRKEMKWWDDRLFKRVVLRLQTTPRWPHIAPRAEGA